MQLLIAATKLRPKKITLKRAGSQFARYRYRRGHGLESRLSLYIFLCNSNIWSFDILTWNLLCLPWPIHRILSCALALNSRFIVFHRIRFYYRFCMLDNTSFYTIPHRKYSQSDTEKRFILSGIYQGISIRSWYTLFSLYSALTIRILICKM